ncbi:MAG: P-loop NTPase [Firmicutes bacterium]|nr:P-loop NTPase [Bacillota bacterium]
MKIAVASGKGGTGKTTIAANLSYYYANNRVPVALLDCDVEEPNCHLFISPRWESSFTVSVPVPEVDAEKCSGCGVCSDLCQFSAIVTINQTVLTFPDLCHGCGLCTRVCAPAAITEVHREIGSIDIGNAYGIDLVQGKLRIGEAMSPPLIKAVKKNARVEGMTIVDCPPGTSCPVIRALESVDFVLLVTEPTPFGLHDLRLAVEMVREMGIPFAVVVNRSDMGDGRVKDYCSQEGIVILLEIPEDREIARSYSNGELFLKTMPVYHEKFRLLAERLAGYKPKKGVIG